MYAGVHAVGCGVVPRIGEYSMVMQHYDWDPRKRSHSRDTYVAVGGATVPADFSYKAYAPYCIPHVDKAGVACGQVGLCEGCTGLRTKVWGVHVFRTYPERDSINGGPIDS